MSSRQISKVENACPAHKIHPAPPQKKAGAPAFPLAGAPWGEVRAALLSRALERTIIAAGGLNGRVRDGDGCLAPAGGTNQGDRTAPRGAMGRAGVWGRRPPPAGPSRPEAPRAPGPLFARGALPGGGVSPAPGEGGVQASRPIRSGRLSASRRLRPRPVKRVVFPRPSGACARDG